MVLHCRTAAVAWRSGYDLTYSSSGSGYSGGGGAGGGGGCGCWRHRGSSRNRGCGVIRPSCFGRHSLGVAAAAGMDWSQRRNDRVRRVENVPGSFFVDHTCIDCDTCRWMAPDTFSRVGPQSAVVVQPTDRAGRVQALKALLSCPTYSIHATVRATDELREAQNGLPERVPGVGRRAPVAAAAAAATDAGGGCGMAAAAEGVYYTGWTDESSYAGCPYLIVRPGGNILVDSPRYSPVLARRLEALGGVRFMFLTHRDDVGAHELWAKHFGATRILHQLEVNQRQRTDKVEVMLSGEGPWVMRHDGSVVQAVDAAADEQPYDVTFIFTPGHTAGHVCMYYAPYKVLFSGDHLCSAAGSVECAPQDELYIFTRFNWYSVPEQLHSVAKLLQYDWLHVLPGSTRFPTSVARACLYRPRRLNGRRLQVLIWLLVRPSARMSVQPTAAALTCATPPPAWPLSATYFTVTKLMAPLPPPPPPCLPPPPPPCRPLPDATCTASS